MYNDNISPSLHELNCSVQPCSAHNRSCERLEYVIETVFGASALTHRHDNVFTYLSKRVACIGWLPRICKQLPITAYASEGLRVGHRKPRHEAPCAANNMYVYVCIIIYIYIYIERERECIYLYTYMYTYVYNSNNNNNNDNHHHHDNNYNNANTNNNTYTYMCIYIYMYASGGSLQGPHRSHRPAVVPEGPVLDDGIYIYIYIYVYTHIYMDDMIEMQV